MKNRLPKLAKNRNSKIWTENQRRALYGEKLASRHLKKQGYRIIANRFWTRYGEIDLIAQRKNVLAFVEVKTRSKQSYGHPLEAITFPKFLRLQRAAAIFMQNQKYPLKEYSVEFLGMGICLDEPKHPVQLVKLFFD